MKLIPLRKFATMTTGDVIKMLMERAPAPRPGDPGGFTPDQVLAGARVLKALRESTGDSLLLEDADHKTLVEFLGRSLYLGGGEELAAIITDIREASAPRSGAPAAQAVETSAT